ncbi:unnamed protein product [Rotaria magnacalcarata]|uniref:Cilia- and flagella-associated protein 45 n=7 Tax=Rotaria magnacalcarata TaxID=392030 RepID=A0A816PAR1_9BILA|nr:unnamed protein product [Rotaria magnacalcarata]CAF1680058.1 unnamed protein product [Rotaria magnacalcarata]CAF2046621.1 unnamed protein product [Rotaria magnacalcarata]CAF2053773.1 unnamed protein product [Rotaria magnacalcarata]CAF2161191.1 unnamed protein product [Rotaria magnacalcarata]
MSPASTSGGSHSGNGSSSSNGKRNGNNYRYRTVNAQSEVDETLFGTPHRLATAAKMREERQQTQDYQEKPLQNAPKQPATVKKEFIRHITKDLIRDIIVPEDPTCTSVIIDGSTYQRLSHAASLKPKEAREHEISESKRNRDSVEDELNRRKKAMQEYDQHRKKNAPLEDIDLEAKEEAEYMLKRANELRQEQEDEVKHLNELILNAKCHAIRDAQLLEKQQIKKEMAEEDKRLDMMMEIERLNALKIQEEIEQRRHVQAKDGASMILKQIEENEKEKVYKEEVREQENTAMFDYMQKLQEKDWEDFSKRKDSQKKLAKDLLKANREIDEQRAIRKQQDRIADLAVLEFQKAKAAREAAQEAEIERKRTEKEKEVARLRAQQERARDIQADKDALRAKREQERREREWREKEKLEALKKKQTEEEMRLAREWQIKNKEQHLAVEAARERAEFERVLKAQLTQAEKERNEELQRISKRHRFADDLRDQIVRHEKQKVEERAAFFDEGVRLDEQARLRRLRLDEIKTQKLNELRRAGVPEKYCADIERKINAPINLNTETTTNSPAVH